MTISDSQTERQLVPLYPWDAWDPKQIEVKPEEWQWCFNLKEGEMMCLEQDWEHKRDNDGISVTRKAVSRPRNPSNWPLLTFAQAKLMRETAKQEDISVRKAFVKLFDRKKLSNENLEMLAQAPDYYIAGPRPMDLNEKEAQRAARTAAFLADVDGSPKPVASKVRGQAVAASG